MGQSQEEGGQITSLASEGEEGEGGERLGVKREGGVKVSGACPR